MEYNKIWQCISIRFIFNIKRKWLDWMVWLDRMCGVVDRICFNQMGIKTTATTGVVELAEAEQVQVCDIQNSRNVA